MAKIQSAKLLSNNWNKRTIRALEMISAEFYTDEQLIDNGITEHDITKLLFWQYIEFSGQHMAYIITEDGNMKLADLGKHPIQGLVK